MPWLIKDDTSLANSLLFVHVPRCGGTSLMHHFELPRKVRQNRSLWGQLGMAVFFSRYQTLESTNFPVWTWGNAFAGALLVPGSIMVARYDHYNHRQWIWPFLGALLCAFAVLLFLLLTFVFTAPVIGRCPFIHRAYLLFVHYVLCRFMESIPWCTGTNITGYMMHLTAHKLIQYQYITPHELETAHSMAIVRNPYARMISIYSFNRFFGEWESFAHFLNDWHCNVTKHYRERGELEEWYTPCHAIPQFEYTHWKGKQIVYSIIKQEDLKYLPKPNKPEAPKETKRSEDGNHHVNMDDAPMDDISAHPLPMATTVSDLPDVVRDALCNMPHTNQRRLKKKWYDYYNQHTLDLVYEMYQKDFEVFDYSPILTQRPDLQPPTRSRATIPTIPTTTTTTTTPATRTSLKQHTGTPSEAAVACTSDGAEAPPVLKSPLDGWASTASSTANSTTSGSGERTTTIPKLMHPHRQNEDKNGEVPVVSFAVTNAPGSVNSKQRGFRSNPNVQGDDEIELVPPSGASSLSD